MTAKRQDKLLLIVFGVTICAATVLWIDAGFAVHAQSPVTSPVSAPRKHAVVTSTPAPNQPVMLSRQMAMIAAESAAVEYRLSGDTRAQDFLDIAELALLSFEEKRCILSAQPTTQGAYLSMKAELDAAGESLTFSKPSWDDASGIRAAIDVLETNAAPSPGSAAALALGDLTLAKRARLESPFDVLQQNPASLNLNTVSANGTVFVADTISEAIQLAYGDSAFAPVVGAILSDLTPGITLSSTWDQISAAFPGIGLPSIGTASSSDGSYSVSLQQLTGAWSAAINVVLNQAENNVASIVADVRGARNSIKSARIPIGMRPQDNSSSSSGSSSCSSSGTGKSSSGSGSTSAGSGGSDACIYQTAKSVVTGLGSAIGFLSGDQALGTEFSNVGSAIVTGTQDIGKISDDLASASLSDVAGIATTALELSDPVVGLIGAGISLVSDLFGGNSPAGQTQAILSAISKLSSQISTLQNTVVQGFATVNANLASMYSALSTQLGVINYTLGTVSTNVSLLQAGLLDTQAALYRLTALTQIYFQNADYESWLQAIDQGCENYSVTYPGSTMDSPTFRSCEATYFTALTQTALDQTWSYDATSYAPSTLWSVFQTNSSPSVLSDFLSHYASSELGVPALSQVHLPNPTAWLLLARAYLDLWEQQPSPAAGVSRARFNPIIAGGQALQQAVRAANSTSAGHPYPAIYNAIVAQYQSAVSKFNTLLESEVTTVASSPTSGAINVKTNTSIIPFVAADSQTTTYLPQQLVTLSHCDGTPITDGNGNPQPPLTFPTGLLTKLPAIYRLYEGFLGKGPITACISSTWLNDKHSADCSKEPCSLTHSTTQKGCSQPQACIEWWDASIIKNALNDWQDATLQSTITFSIGGQAFATVTTSIDATESVNSLVDQHCGACGGGPEWAVLTDPAQLIVDLNYRYGLDVYDAFDGTMPTATTTSVTEVASSPVKTAVEMALTAAIESLNATVYGQIKNDLNSSTPLAQQAQLLGGLKALIQTYVAFGLPNLGQSDAMQSALYGTSAIQGIEDITSVFQTAEQDPITDPTANQVAIESKTLTTNAQGLATAISDTFGTGFVPDTNLDIDSLLADLIAMQNALGANNAVPCSYSASQNLWAASGSGDAATVSIQSPAGCLIAAASQAPSWLTTSVSNNSVTLNATPNTSGSPRSAVAVIGNQSVTVTQPPALGVSQTISFAPLPASVSIGAALTLTATATSGSAITFSSNSDSVCSVQGSTLTAISAGTCSVTASVAGNATYIAATVTQTTTVAPLASQTISFPTLSSTPFGSTPPSLMATDSASLPIVYISNSLSVCAVTGTSITLLSVGTCSITASQVGNGTTAPTAATQTFTITPGTQSITFATPGDVTLPVAPFSLVASASPSLLPVTFVSTSSSVCTVSGSTVSVLAAGVCAITASQSGNNNWAAAIPISRQFIVKAAQSSSDGNSGIEGENGGNPPPPSNPLSLSPPNVTISVGAGGAVGTQTVTLSYQTFTQGAPTFSSNLNTNQGNGWLSVSPATGTMTQSSFQNLQYTYTASVTISVNPAAPDITAGKYTGTVNFRSGGGIASESVAMDVAAVPVPQPTGGIANAASAGQAIASVVSPGSYVAIYGTALAGSGNPSAISLPLPTTLNGTQVSLGRLAMPLLYASPTQINAIIPKGLTPGTYPLVVTTGSVQSAPIQLTVKELEPGIYTQDESGSGPGIITEALTGELITQMRPASAGADVVIYCTGLGTVQGQNGQSQPLDGAVTPLNTLFSTTAIVTATVNGVNAPVLFSGLTPSLSGLYQVNIRLPQSVVGAGLPVIITANDPVTGYTVTSNTVTIAVH
jgi:uncharacterized protein (TIGR03437 family)